MPISAADVKFVASQNMADTAEGGGAPTSRAIQDGVSNSLFNDIPETARAGGQVNFAKVFAAVASQGTDTYLGGNVIVAEPPADPRVSVSIFAASGFFDRRGDARNRVEAYLNRGSMWPGFLLENHITGQRSIQILQREGVDPPTVGKTLFLAQNEGASNESSQYVRVTKVSSEVRTFTVWVNNSYVDFTGLVCTCDISDPLRHDFPGSSPSRTFTTEAGKTIIRDTLVADAANYYSAARVVTPTAIGDQKVRVTSIFNQLVPNSQTETALVDQRPAAEYACVLATAPRKISVGGAPFSQRVKVRQETRAYNYVTILKPLPAPGTLRVTYRAQGKTYALTDDAAGNLSGASGGSGRVDYSTGSVRVTLGALPDEGSAVVFYWGQLTSYTNRSTDMRFRLPEVVLKTANRDVVPGTLVITWPSAGVIKTASANAAGVISGDGVGQINHASGDVFLRPGSMVDAGGQYQLAYEWAEVVEEVKTGIAVDATGSVTVALSSAPLPGSISVQWLTTRQASATQGSTVSSGSTQKSASKGMNKIDPSAFGLVLGHQMAVS